MRQPGTEGELGYETVALKRNRLRLRIEMSEEVVKGFGKRRVGKDGIAQIGIGEFAHHCRGQN